MKSKIILLWSLTALMLFLTGLGVANAGSGGINIDILNFNVIGLLNAFFPYILLLVVISTVLMMFPEAREFLGGLVSRVR